MSLVLDVDGRRNEVDAPADTALLYVLRNDLRAWGLPRGLPGIPSSTAARLRR